MNDIPQHIAIIMDGNGRWAAKRGLPRSIGHKRGAETARRVVADAAEFGVEYITLFGFSAENWKRPVDEVRELMGLLRHYLRSETAELHRKNAKLRVIGGRDALDQDIIELIENAEALTTENDGITVVIALNYGGQQDILQAAQKLAVKTLENGTSFNEEQSANIFTNALSTHDIPNPDLLIRTSGEKRISNFMLWQCAYSEMVFTDTLWPDFSRKDLEESINDFAARDRRFGGLAEVSESK